MVHVPKTGGSDFVGKIIQLWNPDYISPHVGVHDFLKDCDCSKYQLTSGHVFYIPMKEVVHKDNKWLTLLRDPIERVYSHYLHFLRYDEKYLGLVNHETFEQFIYGSDGIVARNTFSKHIGWWPKSALPERGQGSGYLEYIPLDITQDELYDQTMKALEDFWYVGNWAEGMEKVYELWDLDPPEPVLWESRNYRSRISPQVLADLEEFNEVDIRIFKELVE